MFILVILFCGVILLNVLWKVFQEQNYIRKYLFSVPGPPPKPFIGNALDFGGNPKDAFENLIKIQNEYGPISKVYMGPNKTNLIISEPDLVELITKSPKNLKKSRDYRLMSPFLMNGLILSDGKYWQQRRKIITPAFHFKILEDFVTVFDSESDILVTKLAKEIGNAACDVYPYISAFTLDSICETAMGTPVNAQNDHNNEYVRANNVMCNMYIKRKFSFWKQFNMLFKYSEDYKQQCAALKTVHDFTMSVIEKRRSELQATTAKKGTPVKRDADGTGLRKRYAFLDLLLQSTVDDKPLSNDDILEEVNTFMFAGHDTTGLTLSFVLYNIARNPDVQNKVFLEVSDTFNRNGRRPFSIQDLNEMKYLESVIKETLRLYPAVPYISRELTHTIQYKDLVLVKGLMTTIFIYNLHRRPEYFPEPEKFDPNRFLVESKAMRHNFSYIPFSAGPRNCIGQKYAMFEVKTAVAKIVRNFEIFPADAKHDVILSGEVTLKSTNGMFVRLERRNQ